MPWDAEKLSNAERRLCLLLLTKVQAEVGRLDRAALGPGPETLAMAFAYSQIGDLLDTMVDQVLRGYS